MNPTEKPYFCFIKRHKLSVGGSCPCPFQFTFNILLKNKKSILTVGYMDVFIHSQILFDLNCAYAVG